jgi:hypothetical protein
MEDILSNCYIKELENKNKYIDELEKKILVYNSPSSEYDPRSVFDQLKNIAQQSIMLSQKYIKKFNNINEILEYNYKAFIEVLDFIIQKYILYISDPAIIGDTHTKRFARRKEKIVSDILAINVLKSYVPELSFSKYNPIIKPIYQNGNIISINKNYHDDKEDWWIISELNIVKPFSYKEQYVDAILFSKSKLIFSIRKFEETKDGRLFVKIYCYNYETKETSNHYYYSSKSDGFFWRYCINSSDSNLLDKGYNYIVTTFINMELQKYIFHQMSKHKYIVRVSGTKCILKTAIINPLNDRLFTDKSISQNNFFTIFNDIFPRLFYPLPGQKDMITDYNGCIETLELKIKTDTDPTNQEILNHLKTQLLSFEAYKQNIGSSVTEHFKKVYNVFNECFKKYFNFIPETRKIIIKHRLVTIENYNIDMNIYSITIKYKITGKQYTLYYIAYKYLKPGDRDYISSNRKTILHIISEDSIITNSGLDSRYVSAGYFINKFFDYKQQTGIITIGDKATGPTYLFLGDIVNFDCLP